MILQIFNILFIIANVSNVLAQIPSIKRPDNESPDENIKLTLECLAEVSQYSKCIGDKLGLSDIEKRNFKEIYLVDNPKEDNQEDEDIHVLKDQDENQEEYQFDSVASIYNLKKEKIEDLCHKFETSDCKDFVADATNIDSTCLSQPLSGNKKTGNLLAGMKLYAFKQYYLLFCIKDSNGKTCPFAKYLLNNLNMDFTVLSNDAKNAMIADCKDEKCNERMVQFSMLENYLSSIDFKDLTDANNTIPYSIENFSENYKKNKCDTIGIIKPINNNNTVIQGNNTSNTSYDKTDDASIRIQNFTFISILIIFISSIILTM